MGRNTEDEKAVTMEKDVGGDQENSESLAVNSLNNASRPRADSHMVSFKSQIILN